MTASVATSPPDPEVVRQKAAEILSGPDYDLGSTPDSSWSLTTAILRAIIKFVIWVGDLIHRLFEFSPILAVLVVGFLVVAAASILIHLGTVVYGLLRGTKRGGRLPPGNVQSAVDPSRLEAEAESAAATGRMIEAIRLLLAALLRRLELAEKKTFRPGATNREHLRRYRNTEAFEPMRVIVGTVDCKWYGQDPCGPDDYQRCRLEYQRVVDWIGKRAAPSPRPALVTQE